MVEQVERPVPLAAETRVVGWFTPRVALAALGHGEGTCRPERGGEPRAQARTDTTEEDSWSAAGSQAGAHDTRAQVGELSRKGKVPLLLEAM